MTGSGMRVFGYRGATTCHVNPFRVFSYGIRFLQAIVHEFEPEKSIKSVLHFPGAAISGKYGFKVKAHQNSHLTRGIVGGVVVNVIYIRCKEPC